MIFVELRRKHQKPLQITKIVSTLFQHVRRATYDLILLQNLMCMYKKSISKSIANRFYSFNIKSYLTQYEMFTIYLNRGKHKHCIVTIVLHVLDLFWEIFHHSKFTFTVIHNVFTCTQYLLARILCNVEHGGRSCTDYPRISPHRPPPRQAPTHSISRHCDYNTVSLCCTPTSQPPVIAAFVN